MVIIKKASEALKFLQDLKSSGKQIGFAPTMGALHEGHLSLIRASKMDNDLTVSSIFVNPEQFNNRDDFNLYPSMPENDVEFLIKEDNDVLFLPPLAEIYPPGFQKKTYELGKIENVLEGVYRPGHFQGVCLVVDRLLHIVRPHNLYLGQKDYQQCMVIKKLLDLTGRTSEINLHIVPIIREPDGLAMSSRNMRLDKHERLLAPEIFRQLLFIRSNLGSTSLPELKEQSRETLLRKGIEVDYVEIMETGNLENDLHGSGGKLIALIAAYINKVRLIDNMILN